MAELNKAQMDKAVKDTVVAALSDVFEAVGARQIDNYTFAFPVNVEGEDTFAKVAITAVQRKDTKKYLAFDVETAVAAYEEKLAEKAQKAAEKAAKAKKD